MKHVSKFLALMTVLTVLLTGCYPTGEKELPSYHNISSNAQEDPSSGDPVITQPFVGIVSEKAGDAEFNYEISQNLPVQLPKIKLKTKLFDEELVKKVLLCDKTINPDADRPDWVIETTDGSLLVFNYGFSFSDGRVDDNRSNFATIANHYNEYCYSSSEQLKSFSSGEAVERVNKLLGELGIENYGEPCIIPVSSEVGNAYLKERGIATTNKDQSRDDYDLWTEEDGIYILKYRLNLNGTDVCSGNLKTPGSTKTIQGADITAYVTKDLVFYLEVGSWYDVVSLNEETTDLKFSAGYASNALIDHYSKISSLKYPVSFTECKSEYVPAGYTDNNELFFTPAWCFMGYELKGVNNDMFTDCAEYYYAETGIRYMG